MKMVKRETKTDKKILKEDALIKNKNSTKDMGEKINNKTGMSLMSVIIIIILIVIVGIVVLLFNLKPLNPNDNNQQLNDNGEYTENNQGANNSDINNNNKRTLIPSIANEPVLGEGMQAVYWSDENATEEYTADSFEPQMYSYIMGDGKTDTKESRWANAKTEDGSYWVWIPRYAYKITYYTDSNKRTVSETKTQYGDIDVLFMYGTSNTHYRTTDGTQQPLPEGYKVHPAFQAMTTEADLTTNPLGKWDTELEGIWVAKYEASKETSTDGINWVTANVTNTSTGNVITTNAGNTSTTQIRVVSKPSVTSWRDIYQTNIYANCENMYLTLNTHQMKNSEWGAAAYLTYSPYGRNGEELAVNECYDFYTGAGPGLGNSTIYNGWYDYSATNVTNESGDTTAYAFDETYAWNTAQGKLASTTGNIYGIYDMSGGAHEYVASYVNNGHTNLTRHGANMVNSSNIRNKQVYASTVSDGSNSQEADYNLLAPSSNNIYGDAVYETLIDWYDWESSWCYDDSYFPEGAYPFFGRGGDCGTTSNAGVFFFGSSSGGSGSIYGFRPVVCVSSAT